jgi:hypothetical protein
MNGWAEEAIDRVYAGVAEGLFLQREGRESEAQGVPGGIVKEGRHLSSRERRANQHWIQKSREELKKVS